MNNTDKLSEALAAVLISPNVLDNNMEPANVVDVLSRLGSAVYKLEAAVERQSALLAAASIVAGNVPDGEHPGELVLVLARELLVFAEVTP